MKIRAKVDIETDNSGDDDSIILKGETFDVVRICVGDVIMVNFKGKEVPLIWSQIKEFVGVIL